MGKWGIADSDDAYFLELHDDNRYTSVDDCGTEHGDWSLEGDSLKMIPDANGTMCLELPPPWPIPPLGAILTYDGNTITASDPRGRELGEWGRLDER